MLLNQQTLGKGRKTNKKNMEDDWTDLLSATFKALDQTSPPPLVPSGNSVRPPIGATGDT